MSIFLGFITAILDSVSLSFRKMALDNGRLSKTMFKYFAFIFGLMIVVFLYTVFGFQIEILNDINFLLLGLLIISIGITNTFLQLYVLKKVKLSEVLPYDNLDKLFIVIIGFIIYYGTENQASISTLIITLLTITVIVLFSIDFKNFKIPKSIGLFSLYKLVKALTVILTSFFLIKYTNITLVSITWLFELIIFTFIALLLKDSFKSLFQQNRNFYLPRLASTIMGRSAYIIGLYIIQSAGVIIATLLGFLGLVFSIFSMKYILKDNPERKQIILAFIVLAMIGTGYYFS